MSFNISGLILNALELSYFVILIVLPLGKLYSYILFDYPTNYPGTHNSSGCGIKYHLLF